MNLFPCYVGKPQVSLEVAIIIQPHQMMNINSQRVKIKFHLAAILFDF